MDHAFPKRRDPLERAVHVNDGEVGQRGRVAPGGATFVNAEQTSPAPGLAAATFGLPALGELDAEHAGPEPTRAVGIISRELDQAERSVHAADDNGARADRAAPAVGHRHVVEPGTRASPSTSARSCTAP